MTVRISATDWHGGGIDADASVEIARAFAEHGAASIDVSTGQVVADERPAYGRSYQAPSAERIRNEVGRKYGVEVIAVGAISSYDDVNSIILAGRADLCALGRAHLYDPQWTLHAAAEQGYPIPWRNGSPRETASHRAAGPTDRSPGWTISVPAKRRQSMPGGDQAGTDLDGVRLSCGGIRTAATGWWWRPGRVAAAC
jgi:anthraniloyl-CoA monooxygenase